MKRYKQNFVERKKMSDDALEYIARLIDEGYMSGYDPSYWQIKYDRNLEDSDISYIASLVKEGYMSGYDPSYWQIVYK